MGMRSALKSITVKTNGTKVTLTGDVATSAQKAEAFPVPQPLIAGAAVLGCAW